MKINKEFKSEIVEPVYVEDKGSASSAHPLQKLLKDLEGKLEGATSKKKSFWDLIQQRQKKIGRWCKDEGLDVYVVDGIPSEIYEDGQGIVMDTGTGSRFMGIKEAKRVAKLMKKAIRTIEKGENKDEHNND